jgi:hypothetical protein
MIINIVTYAGFAWLRRRVLDLIIEFSGPLYNLLQHFTNHCRRLDILSTTPLYSVVHLQFSWPLLYFLGTEPTENAVSCCQECVFIGPLPSNDSTCYNMITVIVITQIGWNEE